MTNTPQTVLEVQGIHTYYGTIEALKGTRSKCGSARS